MAKRSLFTFLVLIWGVFPFACDFCGGGGGSCPCDMPKVYDFRVLSMEARVYDANFIEANTTSWYPKDSLTLYFGFDETETVYAAARPALGQNLYACSPAEPMATNGIIRFVIRSSEALRIDGDFLPAGSNLNDYFQFGNSRSYGRSYSEFFQVAHQQTLEPRFQAWWNTELNDSLSLNLSANFYFNDSAQSRVENIRLKLKP